MKDHIEKFTDKLLRDRSAVPESIRFYVLDDTVITNREDEYLPVFTEVFSGLDVTALLFAQTSLPFADLLVERADPKQDRLMPKDSETKTFLHDIPFIRKKEWSCLRPQERAGEIIRCLKGRKAMVIEGLGVVASGGITVEQSYIAYSTIFHTTFVKYLLDLLTGGFTLPGEPEAFEDFTSRWLRPIDPIGLQFTAGPLGYSAECGVRSAEREKIYDEICRVGRYTVEKGLVDSFFGNISYFDGKTICISQTASSLDELEGHIDPVPLDYSSTAGLSASSELPAHKAIYLLTNYHAVLHGHPKFSVILSMHCEEQDCDVEDCGKNCKQKRAVCGVPIVSGEIGAGGLARTVPPAVKDSGICIVYGHGIFSAGERDFRDAFMKMAEAENRCREEYFRLMRSGACRMRNKDR
jgi:ribulose-5-phosphate 4-epimerase/fuculose-1-phosphate aldolase